MNCENCNWKNPDTCRDCRAREKEKELDEQRKRNRERITYINQHRDKEKLNDLGKEIHRWGYYPNILN